MNDLIERLKAQDEKEAHQLRKARPLWLLAAGFFSLLFVGLILLPPQGMRPARLWLFGVLTAIYLLNALLLARKLRLLAKIDYTASVRLFLTETEKRLLFMRPPDYWLSGIGLTILGVISGFYVLDVFVPRHASADRQTLVIVLYVIGYTAMCVTGFLLTYKNWKATKGPLLGEIRNLKRELTADEPRSSNGADSQGA